MNRCIIASFIKNAQWMNILVGAGFACPNAPTNKAVDVLRLSQNRNRLSFCHSERCFFATLP